VNHLTPTLGTEVKGVQLSSLSDAGKDQLARYVAERKVVAFRDQDFADLSIPDALKFGGYFGQHHVHPTSGSPKGHPEIHLVHRAAGDTSADEYFSTRTSSVAWHTDVSYEAQPPGTTFLYILDKPETGGDTLFANTVEAYNRLSPLFQQRLHGLQAVHSAIEQANASVGKGSVKRREPVYHAHPIVRTHPVTGEKALYINPQCKSVPGDGTCSVSKLTAPSHARDRGAEEGGVGRAPQVPVRPYCSGRRLPRPRQVGGEHRGRLGQPGDATLGPDRLEERSKEASGEDHTTGRKAV